MSSSSADFNELLAKAREGNAFSLGQLLEAHRCELVHHGQVLLGNWPVAGLAAADLAQIVAMKGSANFRQFHGQTEAEWRAWLRGILENEYLSEVRRDGAQCRNARREKSLQSLLGNRGARRQMQEALARDSETP